MCEGYHSRTLVNKIHGSTRVLALIAPPRYCYSTMFGSFWTLIRLYIYTSFNNLVKLTVTYQALIGVLLYRLHVKTL
jgi:hypothetical protein